MGLARSGLTRVTVPVVLFILFVGVPILEIAAFIKIGEAIGVLPTLLGCVATAIIGATLVRHQGFGVLRDAQAAFSRQELPVDQLASGVFILIAGVLLMTPGYVTDTMGFLLLAPPVRMRLARAAMRWAKDRADIRVVRPSAPRQDGAGVVIEGEAVDVTNDTSRAP
jgi:UPF0716 protein FxsA